MSDDGDRTCPLCAEEMDITDQQLKPCKCGYEICVWCWHHIMEMAEKEDTEGRCPACRTPYDKDRIVKMAANCERMVAEITAEKKQKPQKVKAKSTSIDARNHLSSVRVIQRNLVYIIGLPNNLMDESLLERREYFGQYGKVMKVSISRPTGAAAQQALANNTFSVYITYAREEEAVRCIQAVHNFVLEGKSLRACFGTTKYCHQWLRNLSCNNPDCLYLHDIGSQEDSFTKDEIISAYTRSRVPQIVLNASLRRAGNILPPPADDFSSNSNPIPSKPPLKNGSNSVTTQAKISPPNSSSGKSTLPAAAAWGLRNLSPRPAVPASVGPLQATLIKQKSDPSPNINTNLSTKHTSSAWHDDIIPSTSGSSKIPESKQVENTTISSRPYKSGISNELDIDLTNIPSAWNDDPPIATSKSYEVLSDTNSSPQSNPNPNPNPNREVSSSPLPTQSSPFTTLSIEPTSDPAQNLSVHLSSVCLDTDISPPALNEQAVSESETLLLSTSSNHAHTLGLHKPGATTNYDPLALRDNSSIIPNGSYTNKPKPGSGNVLDSLGGGTSVNTEESSIISDILALDFDPWDESSSLSSNITAPWRCKSTGQSRFLFARQEDLLEGSGNLNSSYQNGIGFDSLEGGGSSVGFARNGPGLSGNTRTKVSAPPGFSTPSRVIPPPGFSSHDRSPNHFYDVSYSENRLLENQYQQANLSRNSPDLEFIDPAILAVGKGRMAAALNEPGLVEQKPIPVSPYRSHFNSSPSNSDPRIQLLMQQALAPSQNPRMPDHHIRDSYLSLNDSMNGNFSGNYGGSRFIGQNYNQVSPHQHQRSSHLSNGGVQWDGWSDLRMGDNMGMSEILRNERAMLNSNNNLYGGNEENSFHLPGQNDLFNRAFGL